MVKEALAPLLKQLLSVARRYRDTLRSHVVPPPNVVNTAAFRQEEDDSVVWIETKSLIRPTVKLMEGVEVFALLAYVDWELWKQARSREDMTGIELGQVGECTGPHWDRCESVVTKPVLGEWLAKSSHVYSQSKQLQDARVLVHKILASRGRSLSDVLASSEPKPAESILHTSKPSFPEIVVGLMTDTTMPYVASLIQLIGYKTRKVSFSNHFTEELTVTIIDGSPYYSIQRYSVCPGITEWTHRVLMACPELDEFAFDCPKFDTLQPFVDSAVSGASHLRCLSVASIPMLPDGHIQNFLRALADPNHLLAVYLQELKLTFKITSTNTGAIHLPIREMLRENRRLRKIMLTFDLQNNLRHLETSIQDAFEELCKEERWIRIGSVPLRSKLAFVSISQGNHGFVELDSSVVGAIFDLAAPGARRELNVEVRISSTN